MKKNEIINEMKGNNKLEIRKYSNFVINPHTSKFNHYYQ